MSDIDSRSLEREANAGNPSARLAAGSWYARIGRMADAVDQLVLVPEDGEIYASSRKLLVANLFHHAIQHSKTTNEDYVFKGIKRLNTKIRLGLLANYSDPLYKQTFLWELAIAYRTLEEYMQQGMDINPEQTLISLGAKKSHIKAARKFYKMCQESTTEHENNATRDLVDYDKGNPNIEKLDPTDRSVLWTVEPTIISPENGGWKAEDGQTIPIAIPERGWQTWARIERKVKALGSEILLNEYLLHRPDTGTPVKVKIAKQEAIQDFQKMGIPRKVAEEAASLWDSKNEGQGQANVVRCANQINGPLFTRASGYPDYSTPDLGSFRASRSPSGARR